jgi:hypothetical protein
MSEKKRQKKDGEDKNKNNRRMRTANADVDYRPGGRTGQVKSSHKIDSVRSGYNGYGDQT